MPAPTKTFPFLMANWRFLLFGLLVSFWSSPGQTFVIALFGEELRGEFDLSHGEFGTLYTFATLLSALCLWKAGPLVDHLSLKSFVMKISVTMTLAIFLFAGIQGPFTLFLGIFFVRFIGQGMMPHISLTAIARRYEKERGRAISVAALGFPLGQTLFPPLVAIALIYTDWRNVWLAIGALCAITLLPVLPKLITHTKEQDGQGPLTDLESNQAQKTASRADTLREVRFYLLAMVPVTQAAIITGILFHQAHIVSLKGWNFELWSLTFPLFAAASVSCNLLSGFLVDHFRASKVIPFALLPLFIGCLLLSQLDGQSYSAFIMIILGGGIGLSGPSMTSLWPELYGTRHLGAIKSAVNTFMVFGSALGPVVMGLAFDENVALSQILMWSAGIAAIAAFGSMAALKKA